MDSRRIDSDDNTRGGVDARIRTDRRHRSAAPVLRAAYLRKALAEQFNELARKLTPHNLAEFVDLPCAHDGQVVRLTPISFAAEGWSYIE